MKDAERRAITETHIGIDGLPVESLVSVACIYDKIALDATGHMKSHLSDIINTKTVVVISTDGASVCFGRYREILILSALYKMLRASPLSNTLDSIRRSEHHTDKNVSFST